MHVMSWSHVTVSQGYGVMAINSIGEPYNYQCMEAIAQVQSLEFEKGIVCNVCEIVYLLEMLIKHNICCYISSILILYCNVFYLLCCILHISTVTFLPYITGITGVPDGVQDWGEVYSPCRGGSIDWK